MGSPKKKIAKKHPKPKRVSYAYRDSTGKKVLLSVKEAHAIAKKKKAELAVAARKDAADTEIRKLKSEGDEYKSLERLEKSHIRRAEKLERTDYGLSKMVLSMGMRKVKSKNERAEPASKAASKIIKKRKRANS